MGKSKRKTDKGSNMIEELVDRVEQTLERGDVRPIALTLALLRVLRDGLWYALIFEKDGSVSIFGPHEGKKACIIKLKDFVASCEEEGQPSLLERVLIFQFPYSGICDPLEGPWINGKDNLQEFAHICAE